MMTKASLDATDEKLEEEMKAVAESIEQYIGVVNDTSKNQYDDFNKNLKAEFGKNLEDIQSVLNSMREEIDQNNEKFVQVEKTINKVDVEG